VLNKGDWLSGLAGVAGLLGIAWGFWWADSAAAAFISYEIIGDGWENLRNSVEQLMNKRPTTVETKEPDPTPQKVSDALERLPWVQEARVRLREDGDVFVGEAFIIPRDEDHLLDRVHEAAKVAESVDWRMHEISIVPVRSFD
jgi:divalent metal cation (Fe/Co/Zn/Cd) transporter